jgi:hypothetical protein
MRFAFSKEEVMGVEVEEEEEEVVEVEALQSEYPRELKRTNRNRHGHH